MESSEQACSSQRCHYPGEECLVWCAPRGPPALFQHAFCSDFLAEHFPNPLSDRLPKPPRATEPCCSRAAWPRGAVLSQHSLCCSREHRRQCCPCDLRKSFWLCISVIPWRHLRILPCFLIRILDNSLLLHVDDCFLKMLGVFHSSCIMRSSYHKMFCGKRWKTFHIVFSKLFGIKLQRRFERGRALIRYQVYVGFVKAHCFTWKGGQHLHLPTSETVI